MKSVVIICLSMTGVLTALSLAVTSRNVFLIDKYTEVLLFELHRLMPSIAALQSNYQSTPTRFHVEDGWINAWDNTGIDDDKSESHSSVVVVTQTFKIIKTVADSEIFCYSVFIFNNCTIGTVCSKVY